MSTTESDRILAAGVPITLIDGREVRLRYGMRGLKAIEDEFGSLAAIQNVITEDGTGKAIGPLVALLAAGLTHEGLTKDDLLDLTSPLAVTTYVTAVGQAFEQAFPEEPAGTAGKAPAAGSSLSPGAASTTPLPSDSVALTPSSGA